MNKFKKQTKIASAYKGGLISHAKMTSMMKTPVGLKGFKKSLKEGQFDVVLKDYVRTPELINLGKKAYDNKRGYSIGYVKGEKVMYVSGSRNLTDWVFNVVDDVLPTRHQHLSNRTAANLTRIAKEADVDVVVGHSRGAMLVSKMNIDPKKKLGLDGAMRLAPKNKRHMMNLYQKQTLDRFINRRGSHSRGYKVNRLKNYHFIERDAPTSKSRKRKLVRKRTLKKKRSNKYRRF